MLTVAFAVDDAIRGLAKHLSGTSEWNTVLLQVNLKTETLQLAEAPRFVPAAELCSLLSSNEPRLMFYRYDYDHQARNDEPATVLYIYCCPGSSSIRSKMLYSCTVIPLMASVKQIDGMRIGKKVRRWRSSVEMIAS